MSKPLILIVNDDGITAPGIAALVAAMKPLGELLVVAPDSPQSGMGHAITLSKPLRLRESKVFGNVKAYECSGTPVDCVKLAVDRVLHRTPDICVSGVNHGSNSSINIIYSGTMSAAMEASLEGIPSVGFSLLNFSYDADFTTAKYVAQTVVMNILKHGLPKDTLLNVNIPYLPLKDLKGMKICRQANAKWEEEYLERMDPHGKPYYWLSGKFVNHDHGTDTDEYALSHGYVSIVPVTHDLTAHHAVGTLNQSWELPEKPSDGEILLSTDQFNI